MAHEIWRDEASGEAVDSMFCVGQRESAWHHLGQRTGTTVAWQEAVRHANLDWEVQKQKAFSRTPVFTDANGNRVGGNVVELPTMGIFRIRDGACLGTVGKDYHLIQNRDAFLFVDDLLGAANGAHYESAGALGNGSRIWCLARIPGADFAVKGQDEFRSGLLCATAHDGTMALIVKVTNTRVVCQNTYQAALHDGNKITRIRHTAGSVKRMEEAKNVIQGVVLSSQEMKQRLERLADRRIKKESVIRIMDRLFPKPAEGQNDTRRNTVITDVLNLFEVNDGKNGFASQAGSAYNMLNAVTEYVDHFRNARLTVDRKADGYTLDMARAENALFGTGETLKANALRVIEEETAHDPAMVTVGAPSGSGEISMSTIDREVQRILAA